MKAALIINPGARRNRGGMLEKLTQAASKANIAIFQIAGFDALGQLIDQIHSEAPELLITSGGDGTVHGILSLLGEDERFAAAMPLLALLPHGTTNITARDISLKSPHPGQLERIMQVAKTKNLQNVTLTRRTLRVENLAGLPPQHGFIFAAGAVAKATRKCQLEANAQGWTGNAAVGKMLLGDVVRKLSGKDPSLGGMLNPLDMHMRAKNGGSFSGKTMTIIATTLDNLVLGANPFWNQGKEPLHITRVAHFSDKFLTSLYHILYGNKSKLPGDIFQSFSDEGFELKISSDIVIDGEFYAAREEAPLKISAGPLFRFLRL